MENKFMSCIGWIVGLAFMAVVGTLADGWALSTIWNWFMPKIFTLPMLTFMQAVGVSLVFSLFVRSSSNKSKSDNTNQSVLEIYFTNLIVLLLTPAISVFFGWVILQFAF